MVSPLPSRSGTVIDAAAAPNARNHFWSQRPGDRVSAMNEEPIVLGGGVSGGALRGCAQKKAGCAQKKAGCAQKKAGCAQKKWGPALLPAPTAPSEGSAGVRDLIRRSFTVLDPGSPAQASLPIVVVSRRTRSRPSAALLGSIPFRVCFPPEGSAFATEGSTLPAPLASWSGIRFAASSPFRAVLLQSSFHRLPAEIGALEPALPKGDGAAALITG